MLNRNAVEKLIRESAARNKKARREYHLFEKTLISVKGNIFPSIDFSQIVACHRRAAWFVNIWR